MFKFEESHQAPDYARVAPIFLTNKYIFQTEFNVAASWLCKVQPKNWVG